MVKFYAVVERQSSELHQGHRLVVEPFATILHAASSCSLPVTSRRGL